MPQSQQTIDRRSFLKGSALLGGAAAVMGLAGCAAPASGAADLASTGVLPEWDEEFDFVVVGGGCASYAAALAANNGASTLLVDKGDTYGGTTAFSGNGMWVPGSWLMAEAAKENPDIDPDTEASIPEIVEYALACDAYGTADPELVTDYVTHISSVLKKFGEEMGVEYIMGPLADYYGLPGAKFGRQVSFAKDGAMTAGNTFAQITDPLIKQTGVEVRTKTPATKLYRDETGAVVGLQVETGSKTSNIKANKGVLLNTGGFDHNAEMVATYLRGPILGSNAVLTNTGDGHKMGAAIGAELGNMACVWGTPFYITADDAPISENLVDWFTWRGGDHSIIVNKYGKRFGDETSSYPSTNLTYYQYSTRTYELENIPAFHIGDQSFVAMYGYPGVAAEETNATQGAQAEGLPEWVKTYDNLEELARDNGIDPDGLAAEVERWNAFCEEGADGDFNRPSSNWPFGIFFPHDEANPCMGKIEQPPFFCAKIGPGTCGTSGGLKVNADAQVIDVNGEIIPGLYASGNCSCGYFGAAYPGPGSTVGAGVYRALRAANHAIGLDYV